MLSVAYNRHYAVQELNFLLLYMLTKNYAAHPKILLKAGGL